MQIICKQLLFMISLQLHFHNKRCISVTRQYDNQISPRFKHYTARFCRLTLLLSTSVGQCSKKRNWHKCNIYSTIHCDCTLFLQFFIFHYCPAQLCSHSAKNMSIQSLLQYECLNCNLFFNIGTSNLGSFFSFTPSYFPLLLCGSCSNLACKVLPE